MAMRTALASFVSAVAMLLAVAGCGTAGEAPATYRVLSFNVLCSVCDFSFDPWEDRVGYFGDIFSRLQPDLIGLQEIILPEEVDQVMAVAPGYTAVYYHGTTEYYPYPDAVVAFRTDRFELLESGEYWLSPTPDVPWSMGFSDGQDIPRLVAWVHLKDTEFDSELYFSTTHFDAVHPHQESSAPLVLERMEPWTESMPAIITGDFNLEPYHPAFGVLTSGVDGTGFHLDDTWEMAVEHRTETNSEPAPAYDPSNRIDHVLVSGANFTVPEWIVDLHVYGPVPQLPSDHKVIMAVVQIDR